MQAGSRVTGTERSPSADEVLIHLDGITHSKGFTSAPRKGQLLRYLVERALAGEPTTEYAIGVDIFERPASFNPGDDSIVRTETTRLRQKLRDYYASHPRSDGFRIELPPRSYTPVFVPSRAAVEPAAEAA